MLKERKHLATLVEEMEHWGALPAVVRHAGVRRRVTSYASLAGGACWFAAELRRRGIAPGERVLLWGENSSEWIACFFGCVLRGVLVVPLDAGGSTPFAERVVRETSPALLAGDRELLAQLAGRGVPQFSLAELRAAVESGLPPGAASAPALTLATLDRDTPLQILFTSGTTGEPKGIVHTHGNLLASLTPIEREIAKYRRYERVVHPLRILHTLPLSHVFGQFMGLWVAPVLGATVHYEGRLEADWLLLLLRAERISVLAAVPRVLQLLRAQLVRSHPGLLPALEQAATLPLARRWWAFRRVHRALGWWFWAIVCGGATLPGTLEAFWTSLGVALIQGYGMTETSALITLNHPFRPARGSLGATLPGRELRLTEEGEVMVRGEMVARAIWQHGRMEAQPRDAWLATGDLARRDEQGRLYYQGRTGERLVTSAGLNVYLGEIEKQLGAQGEVRAAAVLATDGPQGPAPVAVLVASDEDAAAAAVESANATLETYQRIARWWLWPALDLPRTVTGKVRRGVLQAWVEEQLARERDGAAAGGTGHTGDEDPLLQWIATVTGTHASAAWSSAEAVDLLPLESAGIDSLGRVQLQAALEEAGLGERFGAVRTLGELRALTGLGAAGGVPGGVPAETPRPAARVPAAAGPAENAPAPAGNEGTRPSALPFLYLRWPGSAPVQAVRMLFLELVVRPLVWLLARPAIVWHDETTAQALRHGPGALLLIANHVSSYDVPLLLYALPGPVRRRVTVAAAGEMMEDWRHGRARATQWRAGAMFGPALFFLLTALFHVFPLPRSRGFRAAFQHAGRALDRGYSVLVFPEGTRSHGGPMQGFRSGIGLLAREADAAILPMATTQRRGAAGGWRPFAATVHLGALLTRGDASTPQQEAQRLEARVRALLGPAD